MASTTDDTVNQQLKDLYGKLGLHRQTDNDQRPVVHVNGDCGPNPTCLALQDLITSSQKTFRGRKNSKALIMDGSPLFDETMAFVKAHQLFFSSAQYSGSVVEKSDLESCVFHIVMLEGEGERERTQQEQKIPKRRVSKGGPQMTQRKRAEMLPAANTSQSGKGTISVALGRRQKPIGMTEQGQGAPRTLQSRLTAMLLKILEEEAAKRMVLIPLRCPERGNNPRA